MNTGSDVISHVTITQSPTTWCQKAKIVPPSFTHHYTLPLKVNMSSFLKGNHNFCNFGGKWSGSIDYNNGTMVRNSFQILGRR